MPSRMSMPEAHAYGLTRREHIVNFIVTRTPL
jgi:hypothetical protein